MIPVDQLRSPADPTSPTPVRTLADDADAILAKLDRVTRVLIAAEPSIVALREMVRRHTTEHRTIRTAEDLGQALGDDRTDQARLDHYLARAREAIHVLNQIGDLP